MAASKWLFTNEYITKLHNGTFAFTGNTVKCALFKDSSNIGAGSTTYAALTNETDNGNGYTTGGVTVTESLAGTTTVTFDGDDPTWTASGGPIVARYAVLYDSTAGRVICYCLLDTTPADVTVADGTDLVIQLHANGFYQAAQVP